MKTDFVLVDFENVQPKKVTLPIPGRTRSRCSWAPTKPRSRSRWLAPSKHSDQMQSTYRRSATGRNALDFHIAYYIGPLAAESPDARLHVISKDTGFDPLIKHLHAQGISCQRSKSLSHVLSVKALNSERNPEESLWSSKISRSAKRPSLEHSRPSEYYQRTVWQSTQCGRRWFARRAANSSWGDQGFRRQSALRAVGVSSNLRAIEGAACQRRCAPLTRPPHAQR